MIVRDDAFLTSGEAARRLHIGKKTLLRAVQRGDLAPAHRTPRGYARFHAADVRAYAARLSVSTVGGATALSPGTDSRGFRWVLLRCLKAVRFERSAASLSCLFQGSESSNRPKTPGSTRLT